MTEKAYIAAGDMHTPKKGYTFSVTVTYDSELEVDYKGVIAIRKIEDAYWLEQKEEDTLTEIPFKSYKYIQIKSEK